MIVAARTNATLSIAIAAPDRIVETARATQRTSAATAPALSIKVKIGTVEMVVMEWLVMEWLLIAAGAVEMVTSEMAVT